jgi:hypothetical protein
MNKIFILAGTYEQFRWFVHKLENDMFAEGIPFRHNDFVYVTPDSVRGCRDIWGYKVGTWRKREDLYKLYDSIASTFSSIQNDFIEVAL